MKLSTLQTLFQSLNMLALLAISAILLIAFYIQFFFGELPCPLCSLQRAAFIAVGIGLVMNLKMGLRANHYALLLLGALLGGLISLRQMLLHVTGRSAYGSPVLGLHDYTWAALFFFIILLLSAFVLLFDQQFTFPAANNNNRVLKIFNHFSIYLFLILIVIEIVTAFLQCGFHACPQNPVKYLLLH